MEVNLPTEVKKVQPKNSVNIYADAVKLAAQLRREKLDLEKENERIKQAINDLKTHRQQELSIAEAALRLDLAELKAEHEKNKESYENARQLAMRLLAEKEALEKENKALNKSLEYLKAAMAAKDAPTPEPDALESSDVATTAAPVKAPNKTSGGPAINVHVERV
ncbi:hypothetical protein AAVH_11864 [Aphelenchoides avenae]|nr:hypothetical protein AAVH_11864 [Aphelenchus avenae]